MLAVEVELYQRLLELVALAAQVVAATERQAKVLLKQELQILVVVAVVEAQMELLLGQKRLEQAEAVLSSSNI